MSVSTVDSGDVCSYSWGNFVTSYKCPPSRAPSQAGPKDKRSSLLVRVGMPGLQGGSFCVGPKRWLATAGNGGHSWSFENIASNSWPCSLQRSDHCLPSSTGTPAPNWPGPRDLSTKLARTPDLGGAKVPSRGGARGYPRVLYTIEWACLAVWAVRFERKRTKDAGSMPIREYYFGV